MSCRRSRRRRLTRWHRSRVLAAYARGASVTEAARRAGISTTTAYRILDDAGVVKRTPVYPAWLIGEAERLYVEERLSCRGVVKALARRFDRAPSQQWVFDHLRRRGVLRTKSDADRIQNSRRTGKDYSALRRTARRLAQEKRWSVRHIARVLDVSRGMVRRSVDPVDRCDPSQATTRRAWQAEHPDVESRLDKHASAVFWRRQGRTYREIAGLTGLSIATIYLALKAAGMTRRQRTWCGPPPEEEER